jgi:glycosyltransferase involved in cell wall biosynthesis
VNFVSPKFSILCLTFGQSKFRIAAIKSVLDQDYTNWELIVIDPSLQTFKELRFQELIANDERIICLDAKDSGPAEGLNNGLSIASGELIVCLNGDDLLLKDCFSRILRKAFVECRKSFAVIHGDCIIIDERGNMLKKMFADRVSMRNFATGQCLIPHPSTFYRREFLIENDIRFNEENRTCWDSEIALSILQAGGTFTLIKEFLSAFRLHPNSISGSGILSSLYKSDKQRILKKARESQSSSTLQLWVIALLLILKRKMNFRQFK